MTPASRSPWLYFLSASLFACQIGLPTQENPTVPWVHWMSGFVATEQASAAATRRLNDRIQTDDQDCGTAAYQAIELVADVAPPAGAETILASYAHGIVVLDREGQLVASTNGYRCDGTVDAIESLAVGSAFGESTITVVAKNGGRSEYTTFVGLFRIGFDKRLDPVFTAIVEEHDGPSVRRGAIYMLPGGLVYRLPDGRYALYVFDPIGRAYFVPIDPLDDPNHEPPIAGPRSVSLESS